VKGVSRFSSIVALASLACTGERPTPPALLELSTITVAGASNLERGTRDTLTATSQDREGAAVTVPIVWRSSNEAVATFERGGVLVALDTGLTVITASSLGVTSAGVQIRVVWTGPATIDTLPWTRPSALNTGATLTDSIRVRVTNIAGAPVPNANVRFSVTAGGGSVAPEISVTGPDGVASAQWTLGGAVGTNTVTATVVHADGTPNPLVANSATFSIGGYDALTVEGGNNQSGQILSDLPTHPSVRLVDSLGAPRGGVPIVFTAHANGRVSSAVVSTDANGIATPGTWTLGDIPGDQLLVASVSDARVTLHANGTGTPIHYRPSRVIAGGFSTCALESDGSVKCWGESPQNGGGTASNSSIPTAVAGSLVATTVSGGQTHYCALTSTSDAWCWGTNALPDTTGSVVTTNAPTEVQSDISWSAVSPGSAHNCAIDASQVAYCWGSNTSGQLGDQSTTTRFTIRPVQGGFTFTQIASGGSHTCGLSGAAAFCWGSNQFRQLGDGSTEPNRTAPTVVLGGQAFQSVGSGQTFSCGLNTQGRTYCWGSIAGGGNPSPITYAAAPNFTSITVGVGHACGVTVENDAYCWGINTWGQVGDSTTTSRTAPTKVAGTLKFHQVSAGAEHTCGLTTDGAVACWGRNRGGELGESTAAFRTTPKHVVLGVQP
jgi:alpha-tubulin suppressor-like RCC1 family protein